jgi:3',5'-cyclic AMP phosphodiesterase CpdA
LCRWHRRCKEPSTSAVSSVCNRKQTCELFYHLGDVVYYNGESKEYYPQFYEPYQHYQNPIFAIPGNHDGDPSPDGNEKSLDAFVRNFCATSKNVTPDAGEINRSPMVQSNVYWTLEAPYVTIIGLYTNVPEGGVVKKDQADWFQKELENADKKKALIVALHHPVFSMDKYHTGSQAMLQLLDNAIDNTGIIPDAVFTAHVHNYQRFTRIHKKNKKVPYIVAGAGGYWHLHWVQDSVRSMTVPGPIPDRDDVTLEKYCDDHHGFLLVQVTPEKLFGEYYIVPNPQESWHRSLNPERFDAFEFPLPPAHPNHRKN